jgi:hypothetical protein
MEKRPIIGRFRIQIPSRHCFMILVKIYQLKNTLSGSLHTWCCQFKGVTPVMGWNRPWWNAFSLVSPYPSQCVSTWMGFTIVHNAPKVQKFPFPIVIFCNLKLGGNRPLLVMKVSRIYLEMPQYCTGFAMLKFEFWH